MSSRAGSPPAHTLPRRARVEAALDLPEGVSAMLVMSVRIFLILITLLAVGMVVFLIATA
jgi:hypothetical protein